MLVVNNDHEVGNVIVDELEHVRLVSDRVLKVELIAMVFHFHEKMSQSLINLTKNNDEERVNHCW